MVKAFGWSLRDLDETDIETLLPFVYRFTATEGASGSNPARPRRVYVDQVDWLR